MVKGKKPKSAGDVPATYPLCDFLSDLRDVLRLQTSRRYCFILGSGASLPSGIMSGRELATNWIKELFLRSHPSVRELDTTEDKVKPWATATLSEISAKGIEQALV